MKCDMGNQQVVSVLFRLFFHFPAELKVKRGWCFSLHLYADILGAGCNCFCCTVVFKPTDLSNTNKNISEFLFYSSLGQPPTLQVRISHLGNGAVWHSLADLLLAFSGEQRFRLELLNPGSVHNVLLCAETQLSLLKGKKSHLIITWPMGAKYSSWYNELCILIGFIIRRELQRENVQHEGI